MEEADNILIQELTALGFSFTSLADITADTFVICIGHALATLFQKLKREENFMDQDKVSLATRYHEAENKQVLCQTLVNYIKKLGYSNDVSFNMLFNPSVPNIRKILSFLFERIGQAEEGTGHKEEQQEANAEFILKRRLQKWRRKAWLIPEFQVGQKPNRMTSGRVIQVHEDRDVLRIGGSKKLNQVH